MAVRQTNAGTQQTSQDAQDLNNPSSQTSTNQGGTTTSSNEQRAVGTSQPANNDTSATTNDQVADSSNNANAAADDRAAATSGSQPADNTSDAGAAAADSNSNSEAGVAPSETDNAGDNQVAPGDADTPGTETAEDERSGERVYIADLDALNNSGVDGFAIINTQADGSVTVNVVTDGLEADQALATHINGFAGGKESVSPTVQQDADRDGLVERAEGESSYGPSLANLTAPSSDQGEQGDDNAVTSSAADAPASPDDTGASAETYTFDAEEGAALLKTLGGLEGLDKNAIVLNGAAGEGGASALPLASGEIQEVTGLSAQIALELLEQIESDPTADELASTFYTVQALQAFAAVREEDASDETVDGTGSADEASVADNRATPPANDDTQSSQVESANQNGDLMFA